MPNEGKEGEEEVEVKEEGKEGEEGKKGKEKEEEKAAGDIMRGEEEGEEGEEKPDPAKDTVPLAKYLETKKELRKALKRLEDKTDKEDLSEDEIADELKTLADEFDIEPKFVKKLAKILDGRADKKIGDAIKPIEETSKKLSKKEKDDAIEKVFQTHFTKAMDSMPEFKDIAKPSVIKALSLLPENAKKTFTQLIEETYGHAITGKRTIKEGKPGGGKEPDPVDYNKAQKDSKYFAEVMADPALKKEYNRIMLLPPHLRNQKG